MSAETESSLFSAIAFAREAANALDAWDANAAEDVRRAAAWLEDVRRVVALAVIDGAA